MPQKTGARIALLRGVNVGGNRKLAMADLRELAEELGLDRPKTLLQSGNLVFASGRKPAELERLLERAIAERLGVETRLFVRDLAEWSAALAANPFPDEAKDDPSRLHIVSVEGSVGAQQVEALVAAVPGREVVRAGRREVWIYFPDGAGQSRLTPALIERKLGSAATARNWNTAVKLLEAARELER